MGESELLFDFGFVRWMEGDWRGQDLVMVWVIMDLGLGVFKEILRFLCQVRSLFILKICEFRLNENLSYMNFINLLLIKYSTLFLISTFEICN